MKNNNYVQFFINFNISSNQINYVCFVIYVLFYLIDLSIVDCCQYDIKKKKLKINFEQISFILKLCDLYVVNGNYFKVIIISIFSEIIL